MAKLLPECFPQLNQQITLPCFSSARTIHIIPQLYLIVLYNLDAALILPCYHFCALSEAQVYHLMLKSEGYLGGGCYCSSKLKHHKNDIFTFTSECIILQIKQSAPALHNQHRHTSFIPRKPENLFKNAYFFPCELN